MPDVIQIAFEAVDKGLEKHINQIDSDLTKLEKQLDSADKSVGRFGLTTEQIGSKMSAAGKAATIGLTLPIAGLAVAATKAASDLNETMNKVDVLFGDQASVIKKWSETSATAFGQSKQHALDSAASFAMFAKSAGLAGDEVIKFSEKHTVLASDLASFNNTSPQEAFEAIGSALRGETEPIRRYNVLINEATLKNEALRQGLIKTTTEALTPQQKILATSALIFQQTSAAQGDYAKTADGVANATRTLNEQFQDTLTSLGQALLPTVQKAVGVANDLLKSFNALSQPQKDLIVGFGLMAAAAGPVLTIGGKLVSMFGALSSVGIDAGAGMITLGKTVGETAGYLKQVGISTDSLKFAFQNLKASGALLGAELGVIVLGLIAIGKYLGEVDAASKATTEDLLKMANSGDVFKQAAASTEILAHGQDRLKVALDGTHDKIRAGARDYADYKSSIEATAKAAGYQIDAQGNLVKVTYGASGAVVKLVEANYLLSESNYKIGDSQNFVTVGAGNQAKELGILGDAINRAKSSAQTSVTATQAQTQALREYYTATRDANAAGLIRANEQAVQSIDVLKIALQGAVGKEMESFKAKQDELKVKAQELQGVISTSYGRAKDDAIKSLSEINTQLGANAAAHEEATKRILFDIAAQQLATVQDPQIRAKAMNELALQWGLVDKATYDATTNIIAATSKLASDQNVAAFKENLQGIADKQLGIKITPEIDYAKLREGKAEKAISIPVVPRIDASSSAKIAHDLAGDLKYAQPVITPKVDTKTAAADIQAFTTDKLGGIPKDKTTTVKADTVMATKNVNDFTKLFGAIPKTKDVAVNVDGKYALQTLDDVVLMIDRIVDKTATVTVKYVSQGNVPEGFAAGGSYVVPPNPRGGAGDYFPILAAPGERVTVQTRAQQDGTRTQAVGGDTYNYNTVINNTLAAAMWADKQRRDQMSRSNARMGVT